MAENTFRFRLVTPQRLVREAPIVSLQAPGSEGYLGVLAHHAALITSLRPGRLEVRDGEGKRSLYCVGGGFLEVSENSATVLADSAEPAGEIDVPRAKAALQRAENRLKGTAEPDGSPVDRDRAMRALERAKNRLALAVAERA